MLRSINEKASYLYTLACECNCKDMYQQLYTMLSKYGVECSCSVPAEFDKYAGLSNGYVDHCYEGSDFVNNMLTHEHSLIKFLFSDESFVVTGNDNCDEDEREWMCEMSDVDYPHKTYYKGN